jgi:exodeoxyribonuclease VII large subunit
MFRHVNQSLKFGLKDGLLVIACGGITVYEKRGDYQLLVEVLEPKGRGALQLAFEQLKEKLEKEGLFRDEHKKAIPLLPMRIGVVTSPTGAAIRDILNVIGRRFSSVHVIINPVRVQGEGAAEEIAAAIQEFGDMGDVDVLIVTRGGGSIEDLWAFNEEVVARGIFRCRIPVISAVGHEIDYTIADFVADLRA